MYAPDLSYYRARTVTEAGDLLKRYPGAKLLAGGHSLIPLLKLRLASPPALIDIGRVAELKGVSVRDGVLRIGALTTHAEIAGSAAVRDHAMALAEAAGHVGDPAVRNRGTIGGNVAHADPASDLPIVLTALGARFVIHGSSGARQVEVGAFFNSMMSTALADEDVLVAIEIPGQAKGQATAYVKFAHPASRYAVIGVAAGLTASNKKCTGAIVAIGGLVPRPVRVGSVEKALTGQPLSVDAFKKAAGAVAGDLGDEILGDVFASADYRKAVAPVWVRRAIVAASERLK